MKSVSRIAVLSIIAFVVSLSIAVYGESQVAARTTWILVPIVFVLSLVLLGNVLLKTWDERNSM